MFLPLELENIRDLFSLNTILGFIIIGALNACLMVLISYKFFQAMQQCGYKGKEYLTWLARKDNVFSTRLLMLSILSSLGFLLTNMALLFIQHNFVRYSGFIVYLFFLIIYFKGERKGKDKLPLVMTKRMVRLVITFSLVTVIFSFILVISVNLIAIPFRANLLANFRYAVLCLCPILVPYLILLAYLINEPLERAIINKSVKQCIELLDGYPNLIKIGITGSYGKTSVKEILKTLLSTKYKVLSTPKSYNTPLGIAKTAKRLDETYDVFIAEMGARRVGDIKKLTEIVKPNFAVITGITIQHLESFLAFENIKKTKYEIIENMKEGKAVFSADNTFTKEMSESCTFPFRLAGTDNSCNPYVYASDIKMGVNGTEFTLNVGNESVEVSTQLLGKHNVTNICIAAAVADYLGLDLAEIAMGISSLKSIPHRLEIVKTDNGIITLDDSYNSNPEGIKSAIETLKFFEGKKYVVTPGIVELGFAEAEKNFEFGVMMSKVCDGVILIGRARALKIREGLISEGYPTDKIIMVASLEEAKQEIQKNLTSGDVVLFENDLPDKYN